MAIYSVRYIHKISPRPTDTAPDIVITDEDIRNRKTLGKAFRDARLLNVGERLRFFRVEDEGDKIVAFPMDSIWHSIILENKASTPEVAC